MNILVYGATGSQGGPVAEQLLSAGHRVRVLTRRAENAASLANLGAEVVLGDMGDPASLGWASEGMDAVSLLVPFFTEAPTDGAVYGRNAVDAARAAGVKLLVWNPSGEIPPARSGNPGFDVRLDVLAHLETSGVPYVVVQPTAYMENFLGPWTREEIAEADTFAYPTPNEVKMQWVATEDVARFMVYALEHPELAPLNVKVSGPEALSGEGVAASFARGLGRSVRFRPMSPDEFGEKLDAVFPGMGEAAAQGYRMAYEQPERFSTDVDIEAALKQLPVQLTTLEAWVRARAGAFSSTPEAAR